MPHDSEALGFGGKHCSGYLLNTWQGPSYGLMEVVEGITWRYRAGRCNSTKLHTCVHRIVIFPSRRRTHSFWQILKEVSSPERDV